MARFWSVQLVNLVTIPARPVKVLPLLAQPAQLVSSVTKAAVWGLVLPIPSPVAVLA